MHQSCNNGIVHLETCARGSSCACHTDSLPRYGRVAWTVLRYCKVSYARRASRPEDLWNAGARYGLPS